MNVNKVFNIILRLRTRFKRCLFTKNGFHTVEECIHIQIHSIRLVVIILNCFELK